MAKFSTNGRIAYTVGTLAAGLVIIGITAMRIINLESYAMFWSILAATCFWMHLPRDRFSPPLLAWAFRSLRIQSIRSR